MASWVPFQVLSQKHCDRFHPSQEPAAQAEAPFFSLTVRPLACGWVCQIQGQTRVCLPQSSGPIRLPIFVKILKSSSPQGETKILHTVLPSALLATGLPCTFCLCYSPTPKNSLLYLVVHPFNPSTEDRGKQISVAPGYKKRKNKKGKRKKR